MFCCVIARTCAEHMYAQTPSKYRRNGKIKKEEKIMENPRARIEYCLYTVVVRSFVRSFRTPSLLPFPFSSPIRYATESGAENVRIFQQFVYVNDCFIILPQRIVVLQGYMIKNGTNKDVTPICIDWNNLQLHTDSGSPLFGLFFISISIFVSVFRFSSLVRCLLACQTLPPFNSYRFM